MRLMRLLSLLGFLLMTLPLLAQTEHSHNTLKIRKESLESNSTLIYNKESENYKIETDRIGIDKNSKLQLQLSKDSSVQINFNAQPTVPMLVLPDYINTARFSIYKHLFLFLEGEKCTYPNFVGYISMQGAFGLQLNHHLSITGGLLAIKQSSELLQYGIDRSGIKFTLNYNLNDQANISIWNQYILNGDYKVNNYLNLFMPQTGSGATATLKIGKITQIGVSTQYKFDDQQRKWSQESKAKVQLKL